MDLFDGVSESDVVLIKKLENVASITNKDILTDEEILRGQFLRKKAQDTLLRLDSGSVSNEERSRLSDHISKLSLALAPLKRLPLEVLEQIFRALFANGYNDGIDIPASVSEPPWLLGQVCSVWRRLSRSMPDLWAYNSVTFSLPFAEGLDVDETDIAACIGYPMDLLKEAVHMNLPEVKLRLFVADRHNFRPRGWIPYLSHVSDLEWFVHDTLGLTQPGELSLLKRLTLGVNPGFRIPPDIGIFGSPSLLQELTIQSDIPQFLLYQIPWSQLRKLCLRVYGLSNETRPAWLQLRQLNPFRLMSSLQELHLDLIEELYSIVLSFDFPWHQLSSFSARGEWRACHFHATMEALQKCTSLVELELIHFHENSPMVSQHDAVYKPTTAFPLKHLTLDGDLPFGMVLSISTAGAFVTSLDLKMLSLNLSQFYAMMEHFPRIRTLNCEVIEDGPPPRCDESIILPQLTRLSVNVRDWVTFPSMLVVPALVSFSVGTHDKGLKVLDQILHLAHHSKFDLRQFEWSDVRIMNRDPSTENLKDFLFVLRNCYSVCLHGVMVSQEIIDEIASGQLLPWVEDLDICMPSFDAYYGMVERRLNRDAAFCNTLPSFNARFSPEVRTEGDDRLQELEEMYQGARCSYSFQY